MEDIPNQGRGNVPKVILVIADNRDLLANYTTMTEANVLMISVGSWTDEYDNYGHTPSSITIYVF